ncbi:MerR family transcriptional regulator [Iamia majanohamensis]|uniref:MerR family transcriptional regulator n=1 Tax=Iamia majanohamensis TaxID=467976 RepID=A0AAF0BWS4_9ACTN|nr:MerR family transcriptional regulator [Iamia majanohamensis]WCO68125.1 MerR family transcriptional regulator [Iamia majanohamensis]
MPEDDGEMRLDALAAEAGVASTTVRLYQQRGLLPRPRLVGRTGWYGPAHLARLRLVLRLQEQGFSLAGIARLLESWEHGGDLTDLLDAEAQVDALLHRRTAREVTPQELSARFPAEALTPELVSRAVSLGLVEGGSDGRLRVPDVRFLEVGSELARLGVPLEVVLDQWEELRADTDRIAERFVAVFEADLLPEGWEGDLEDERLAAAAATLARLQHLAGQVLVAALDTSMAAAAQARLGALASPDEI